MKPQIKNGLYHCEFGFPKSFGGGKVGRVPLKHTEHAKTAALSDGYGYINLPVSLDTNRAQLIELEIKGNEVHKLVYRVSYTTQMDLILVCFNEGTHFVVATAWLNMKQDKHTTLKQHKYVKVA